MINQPSPRDLMSAHEERVAQLRHEIHRARVRWNGRSEVRRWVGRQLVRVGTRLAGEPAYPPIRSR